MFYDITYEIHQKKNKKNNVYAWNSGSGWVVMVVVTVAKLCNINGSTHDSSASFNCMRHAVSVFEVEIATRCINRTENRNCNSARLALLTHLVLFIGVKVK